MYTAVGTTPKVNATTHCRGIPARGTRLKNKKRKTFARPTAIDRFRFACCCHALVRSSSARKWRRENHSADEVQWGPSSVRDAVTWRTTIFSTYVFNRKKNNKDNQNLSQTVLSFVRKTVVVRSASRRETSRRLYSRYSQHVRETRGFAQ